MNYLKKIVKYLLYSFIVYFVFTIINLLIFKFPDNNINKIENMFFVFVTYIPLFISCIVSTRLAYLSKTLNTIDFLLGGIFCIGGELLIYLGLYVIVGLAVDIYNLNYLMSGIYIFCMDFIIMYLLYIFLVLLLNRSKID